MGKTIVIKLGTSSIITSIFPYTPQLSLLSTLIDLISTLQSPPHNHKVVLVSSGAIGVGLRRMELKERGKGLQRKQALAAIGQGRLIAMWDNLFGMVGIPIAQVLLTRQDISDRQRYLNAQNTFTELLSMGVIPIVNENDTVSVSEIKFGDNDTLSAITANMVHADYLFLLTDVECLYTDNPRKNPNATAVRVVTDISQIRQQVSTESLGTALGTGGMTTKLVAADLATAAGVTTIVMSSSNVRTIPEILRCDIEKQDDEVPICTRFLSKERRMNDKKWWIAHGLHAAGQIVIDEGAYRAIQRKESGGRLLPAGVLKVEGVFASHQAVNLLVRRRMHPLANSTSHDHDFSDPTPRTPVTDEQQSKLGSPASTSATQMSAPATPNLYPVMSLTPSIADIDMLSVPHSPSTFSKLGLTEIQPTGHAAANEHNEHSMQLNGHQDWEEVIVGKGLALYNSVEIDRLKGLKSNNIATLLGYSESAHVVDSIAFTDTRTNAK